MHPDYIDKVEKAFKCDGVQYYNFREVEGIAMYRYVILQQYARQFQNRITDDELQQSISECEKHINSNPINLTKVVRVLNYIKERSKMTLEPEIMYRIASVTYFDATERLDNYDEGYNTKKIESWKKKAMLDFFFAKPMKNIINLKGMSSQDLARYIREWNTEIKSLRSQVYE